MKLGKVASLFPGQNKRTRSFGQTVGWAAWALEHSIAPLRRTPRVPYKRENAGTKPFAAEASNQGASDLFVAAPAEAHSLGISSWVGASGKFSCSCSFVYRFLRCLFFLALFALFCVLLVSWANICNEPTSQGVLLLTRLHLPKSCEPDCMPCGSFKDNFMLKGYIDFPAET